MICPICNSVMSQPIKGLFALPSVTSDCRPWRSGRSVCVCTGCGVMRRVVKDGALFERVYDDYKSYPEPEGRTRKILEFAEERMPIPESILDIGSGEGAALDILWARNPDALVHGFDPYSNNDIVLKERPMLKYDLVTMFHVLEHIDDVHEMLSYVKSILTETGHLLIQIPLTEMWPFDLVIADHFWHFNIGSIVKLLEKNCFGINYIGSDVIKKELTILASGNDIAIKVLSDNNLNSIKWILSYKKFLDTYKKFLDTVDDGVSVLGTGPAAAWVGSILGNKVYTYLDDDAARIGMFNGKSVQPPEECSIPVVAPFPDWQLPEIKAKHPKLRFL